MFLQPARPHKTLQAGFFILMQLANCHAMVYICLYKEVSFTFGSTYFVLNDC